MEKNRIVMEFFFEKQGFKEVSSVAKAFESEGIRTILMPPEDRGIDTHIIIETADLAKAKQKLKKLKIDAREKEVVLIALENKPGTMAEATRKISSAGINLVYAFSVAMTPTLSYVLLGSENNIEALKALNSSK